MADLFQVVFNKLDESFNIQETKNYGLYMLFSDTGFSYAILDFRKNKFLGVQHVTRSEQQARPRSPVFKPTFGDFLKTLFNVMPWLKNPYKTVRLGFEGKKSTLVPSALFDAAEKKQYLRFTFAESQEEQIFSDHLVPLDAHLIYSIPDHVFDPMRQHFHNVKIVHFSSVLIGSIWHNYKNRINLNHIFLHVRHRAVDIMIFDGRQMRYFNSFPQLNPEDIVYYLVFVLEQLNFNPESLPLVLLGDVETSSSLFDLLFRYVRHIEFGRRNDSFKYSHCFNQVAPHSFYPLLNFQSCGL